MILWGFELFIRDSCDDQCAEPAGEKDSSL